MSSSFPLNVVVWFLCERSRNYPFGILKIADGHEAWDDVIGWSLLFIWDPIRTPTSQPSSEQIPLCRMSNSDISQMAGEDLPSQPSLAWRIGSSATCIFTGVLCRTFLLGLNRLEVHGWDKFQEVLDDRKDVRGRTRGLLTGQAPSQSTLKARY